MHFPTVWRPMPSLMIWPPWTGLMDEVEAGNLSVNTLGGIGCRNPISVG